MARASLKNLPESNAVLSVRDVCYSYKGFGQPLGVLKNLNLNVNAGEFVAIQGPSGSGKSTLFYVMAGFLRPTSGSVWIEGNETSRLNDDEIGQLRNQKLGFVFQQFHLLPRATVIDNILLPLHYNSSLTEPISHFKERAAELAKRLGIGARLNHYPNNLSGGEQQRVAIARALMQNTKIILADEPTGSLDSRTAAEILSILRELNHNGKTILLVTHDNDIAAKCDRICRLRDGQFVSEEINKEKISSHCEPEGQSNPIEIASGSALAMTTFRNVPDGVMFQEALHSATANLFRNWVRTVLTMVGVSLGIAALFSMVTFGSYAKEKILKGYADLGVNRVSVSGYQNWREKATERAGLRFDYFDWDHDVLPLTRVFRDIQMISPVLVDYPSQLFAEGESIQNELRVYGVSESFLEIQHRELLLGKFFSPYHIEQASDVCVIGYEVAKRLYQGVQPVGKILFISTGNGDNAKLFPCRVTGVLEEMVTNTEWAKPNLDVWVPYTYGKIVFQPWSAKMHTFSVQLREGADIQAVSNGMKNYFKKKYGSSGQFFGDGNAILMAQMKKFINLFSLLLIIVGLITLLVGGMGINNMMLVSLAERFKEIGLRKALGATHKLIRFQFLLESILLCALAGTIGAGFGFALYETVIYIASKFIPKLTFEILLDPFALTFSAISIVLVGILSGLVPALKAERLEVIEAMRSE